MTQAIHSIALFFKQHPDIAHAWQSNWQGLTVLAVKNKVHLQDLISKLAKSNIPFSVFTEPDIGNEPTAIAIAPCEAAKRLCSSIPLALKGIGTGINKHSKKEVLS